MTYMTQICRVLESYDQWLLNLRSESSDKIVDKADKIGFLLVFAKEVDPMIDQEEVEALGEAGSPCICC